MTNPFYTPSILKWIKKMFLHAESKEWYETYFLFDLHGVISIPDYRKTVKEIDYYPYVKETLQYISKNRPDVIMILFTSSYPDEIEKYMETFRRDGIVFKYVNENPEISDSSGHFGYYYKKPYFNVLFDDKAGFDPLRDWKPIYDYFRKTKYRPNPNWTFKKKESYHKIQS
jgi:hypothetical protein